MTPLSWFLRFRTLVVAHKIISVFCAVVLIWAGWSVYGKIRGNSVPTRYVVGTAQNGTLVVSVTGTGQVSASEQVDVKSKVSGDITTVNVKNGQKVVQGQVLAYVDSVDAQKALRDAQINLQSAQIALQKLQNNQQAGTQTSADDLSQAYRDALNNVSSAFLDIPGLIDTTRGVLLDSTMGGSCTPNSCQYVNLVTDDARRQFQTLVDRAQSDYQAAQLAYDPNFQTYQQLRLDASLGQITDALTTTDTTAQLIAQAVKSEQNMLDALVNNLKTQAAKVGSVAAIPSQVMTYQATLGSAINKINGIIANLDSAARSIQNSQRAIDASTLSDPVDVQTAQNNVEQKQAAVDDARANLAHFAIRSPFKGTVTKVNIKRSDSLNNGTTVATVITDQILATLSMNEVDAAQIKVGDKATMTFDAVPDLSIAGQVLDVDTLGTVSQGVVTYNATIGFATQDGRIKPGMSVSAAIISDSKTDVLVVPASAVKTQNGQSFVLMFDGTLPPEAMSAQGYVPTTAPHQVPVQVGLASDVQVEIVSGLKAGDQIVTRTLTLTTTSGNATSSAPSLLNAAGVRTGGATGGAFRGGGAATGR